MGWKLTNAENTRPLECDAAYSSRQLTGDEISGGPVVNVNHGTLKAGMNTGGGAHEKTEIYIIVSCGSGAAVWLDEDRLPARAGDVIVIPPGVFHWIENESCQLPFVLLTLWPDEKQNETYYTRKAAWGTSAGELDEEYQQKRLLGKAPEEERL